MLAGLLVSECSVSVLHLTVGVLGLQPYATVSSFMYVLKNPLLGLLAGRTLYPLRGVPSQGSLLLSCCRLLIAMARYCQYISIIYLSNIGEERHE